MLELSQVSSGYGRRTVLWDISLEVRDGEVVALLGPNGAGKTTLMSTIMGLTRATKGQITFLGHRIESMETSAIARLGLSLVPQGRHVFSMLSIYESLRLAAGKRAKREMEDDLDFVFELFPILRSRSSSKGNELSGGQQQMVALARAVMQRPSLILLDEPSTGLSPLVVQELPAMISGVQARSNSTILLVEQDAGLALSLATRGIVMHSGRVEYVASADELKHSGMLIGSYLGDSPSSPEPGTIGSVEAPSHEADI